jgi:phage-related minor tail protein
MPKPDQNPFSTEQRVVSVDTAISELLAKYAEHEAILDKAGEHEQFDAEISQDTKVSAALHEAEEQQSLEQKLEAQEVMLRQLWDFKHGVTEGIDLMQDHINALQHQILVLKSETKSLRRRCTLLCIVCFILVIVLHG